MSVRVLDLDDLGLSAGPEPPEGVLSLGDVWLHPGSNGLHDADGSPVVDAFLRRGADRQRFPHGNAERVEPIGPAALLRMPTVERGVFTPYAHLDHFGHLLTEFAAHVGPLLAHPDGLDGIGGAGASLVVPARFLSQFAALAALLGIPPSRIVTSIEGTEPVRIRNAVLVLPSMVNRHGVAGRHFQLVRTVIERRFGASVALGSLGREDRGERLYLSRARLRAGQRRAEGEDRLESALAARGWRISHPEQLTMDEQLGSLADACTVAGCLGSAMHLLMAFGVDVGRRLLLALGPAEGPANPNVALHAARQGLPFRLIACLRPVPGDDHLLRFSLPPEELAALIDGLADDRDRHFALTPSDLGGLPPLTPNRSPP